MTPTFSVIIPTFNGRNKIEVVISSLFSQSYKSFELIIIDDASTDGTFDFLKNEITLPVNTLILRNEENLGRAGARNAAAKHASGSHLIFFDDDVKLSSDIIEVFRNVICNENCDIVVGKLAPLFDNRKSNFQKYCAYLNQKWEGNLKSGVLDRPYITANNFCINKKMFFQYDGFDERLKDAEDLDLAIKLIENKHEIYFCSKAIAHHKLFSSFKSYVQRQVEYSREIKKLNQINPVSLKWRQNVKFKGFKRLLFKFLAKEKYIELLDKKSFNLIPQKLKFRFYSLLIQAQVQKSY